MFMLRTTHKEKTRLVHIPTWDLVSQKGLVQPALPSLHCPAYTVQPALPSLFQPSHRKEDRYCSLSHSQSTFVIRSVCQFSGSYECPHGSAGLDVSSRVGAAKCGPHLCVGDPEISQLLRPQWQLLAAGSWQLTYAPHTTGVHAWSR